ncbi:MAG: hypothetical protein JKY56_01910, partial [Kofleriaceae bacterium]|nr:hypothetical protein [Kofleriaceae bacterium]
MRSVRRFETAYLRALFLLLFFTLACNSAQVPSSDDSDTRGSDAGSLPVVRVLFVGNSYTSVHDLPRVVATLSLSEQSLVRLDVGMYAPGGQTWEGHDADPTLVERLAEGWDYVVLQDQSQQAFSFQGVKPALISLDAKVRAVGAQSLLYMTWARSRTLVGGLSAFEQNIELNGYYQEAGESIAAPVAPVGRAWERVLRDPNRTLHSADSSHPTELGTYLAACVLFETLTGATAIGAGDGGLAITDADAAYLQEVAAETLRVRVRPTPPLLGHWPLTGASGNDLITSDGVVLGELKGPRSGTRFAGGFGAIPYFEGTRTPHITVSIHAHRDDWASPTPHAFLAETLVGRFEAYELSQFGTTLSAEVYTSDQPTLDPILFDVSALASGWHHLALTYNGSTYALWVDGAEVGNA